MKRFTATILAAALILSMSACGKKPSVRTDTEDSAAVGAEINESVNSSEKSDNELSDGNSDSAAVGNNAQSNAESQLGSGEQSTTEEAFVQVANNATYQNGMTCFSSINAEGQLKYYLYDIYDNKLYDIGNKESYCYSNKIYIVENDDQTSTIYNIETGEEIYTGKVVIQNKDNDCLTEYCNNGKIVVVKEEEGFEGNKLYISILDDSGEWALSPDESLCFDGNLKDYYFECFSHDTLYVYNNYYHLYSLYSFESKKMVWDEIYSTELLYGREIKYPICCIDEQLWYVVDNHIFSCYNANSEIREDIVDPCKLVNKQAVFIQNENSCLIQSFDTDGVFDVYTFSDNIEKSVSFDLSKYREVKALAFTKDRICFSCTNADGGSYIGLMSSDGEMCFEPVKCDYMRNVHMSDNYIVNSDGNYDDKFVICNKTGELIYPYEQYGYEIEAFDNETEMMLVKHDDVYYLVDCNDPAILINPFER